MSEPIPYGYCQCGCGRETSIATRTRADMDCTKGEPVRFIHGHRPRPNRLPIDNGNGTYSIPLTQGKFTVIEADDLDIVLKHTWHAHKPGNVWYAVANSPDRSSQSKLSLHRLIAGAKDGEAVDHISGDGLDNRKSNLRVCDWSANLCNKGKQSNNTSGFKGVSLTSRGTFDARITYRRQQFCLGHFRTAEEAARAYDAKATEIHGEFALTNFPSEGAR